MKLKMDSTPTLYQPEKAERVAATLQKSDPDWEYRVIHDPHQKGFSFIMIYDENGYFIGHFGG